MPTNGMTIDGLNTVSSLTAQDEVPVWDKEASGEPTRKITAQNMANSVKSLASLPNTTEMNTAIAQSTATMVEYRINTGDANTFADGITIVTNSTTSNLPATIGRCAVLTFTVLQSPVRKTQTALSLSKIWVRSYTDNWDEWRQLQIV